MADHSAAAKAADQEIHDRDADQPRQGNAEGGPESLLQDVSEQSQHGHRYGILTIFNQVPELTLPDCQI